MSAAALSWIEARRAAPPESLRARLRAALADIRAEPDGDVADHLARAGLAVLERAAAASDRRDHGVAMELLTADALLTYACEAAAEIGPERLEQVAASCERALLVRNGAEA